MANPYVYLLILFKRRNRHFTFLLTTGLLEVIYFEQALMVIL